MALAPGRCAGARLGGGAARRPLRSAVSPLRRGEAGLARRYRLHLEQGAGARQRPPHRRLRLREAHRRERRVLHPHRLRGEAGQPLRAADRRRRRRRRGSRARLVRADHLAGLVARRPQARLCLVREQEAGGLCPLAGRREAQRHRQLQGIELGARLVARRPQARRHAVARGRLADLPPQRRRQRPAPPHQLGGDRYRAALLGRRPVDLLHLRSRRQPADLPHAGRRRRAAARHLRGKL